MGNGSQKASALDFTSYDDIDSSASARVEIEATLVELREEFGDDIVLQTLRETLESLHTQTSSEAVASSLRSFCALLAESDRPKLTALLVGRLVGMHVATGHVRSLRSIAAEFGVSKQAISNRMKQYALRLGLPRLEQSEAARISHRLTNRRNYGKRT